MPFTRIAPFSKWRNKKSGDYYIAEAVITDYSNARAGSIVVLYHSVHDAAVRGVREFEEFMIKFEEIKS